MTLYEIGECEHGKSEAHQTYIKGRRGNMAAEGPVCKGGVRREVSVDMVAVIDYLIEELAIDEIADRETFLAHAYDMERAALGRTR